MSIVPIARPAPFTCRRCRRRARCRTGRAPWPRARALAPRPDPGAPRAPGGGGGVVVELDLGVERHERAVGGDDERVHLHERRVVAVYAWYSPEASWTNRPTSSPWSPSPKARLRAWFAWRPVSGSITALRIFSGVPLRDLLDLDTTLGGRHEGDAPALAVERHAEVELALDPAALLDVDPPHQLSRRAGLRRSQHQAEHRLA